MNIEKYMASKIVYKIISRLVEISSAFLMQVNLYAPLSYTSTFGHFSFHMPLK